MMNGGNEFDFTGAAWKSLRAAVDNDDFLDQDAELIYKSLQHNLKLISFGDYLRRYIYLKAGLTAPFNEVDIKEYQLIIRSAFEDNHTPASFVPTSAKLSALSKNWLTQQTVKRSVVFLLGFGLNMSVEDVNVFLTKALREPEINPKDPFEVICWYCYKNKYSYYKFAQLWELYKNTPANSLDMALIYNERTIGMRNSMYSVHNDAALLAHVSKLKNADNIPLMSVTARELFMQLYNEARLLIAESYNKSVEEKHRAAMIEYMRKLSNNDRLYDYEKKERLERFRQQIKYYAVTDITESDIEHIICASIPIDRHGNLTPAKASKLNAQFAGKRFSRQRIGEILAGSTGINRFDLITLNFFVFSQKLNYYPDAKQRFSEFVRTTNEMLEKCHMGGIYIQNPYECFVLMCILSVDPLGTYADVWELSYENEDMM